MCGPKPHPSQVKGAVLPVRTIRNPQYLILGTFGRVKEKCFVAQLPICLHTHVKIAGEDHYVLMYLRARSHLAPATLIF